MSFYEKYLELCAKAGKSPSCVALEISLSKTTVNRWKNGGGVTDATALKVANYFGVSPEWLKMDMPLMNGSLVVYDDTLNQLASTYTPCGWSLANSSTV